MADEKKKRPTKTGNKKSKKAGATSKKGKGTIAVEGPDPAALPEPAPTGTVATTGADSGVAERAERIDAGAALLSVGDRNKLALGELTVHYAARDVTVALDGHTAARVMAVYAGVSSRTRTQDFIHPDVSRMLSNVWATFSLDGVLAMSWNPGLPSPTQRTMTVDPPAPEPAD